MTVGLGISYRMWQGLGQGSPKTIFSRFGSGYTQRNLFWLVDVKKKLDCNYSFPSDLVPNGIQFGVKYLDNTCIIKIMCNKNSWSCIINSWSCIIKILDQDSWSIDLDWF